MVIIFFANYGKKGWFFIILIPLKGRVKLSIFQRHTFTVKFREFLEQNELDFTLGQLPRSDGYTNFLEMGKRSSKARPTVLFLHGLGNDLFFPNIGFYKCILRAGFNIITSDLDGHGRGGTSTFSEQNLTSLVDDLVVNSPLIQDNKHDIHLCGFSLGGVLVLDYAARQPKNIKSVTTIGMPLILQGDLGMVCESFTPLLKSFRSALPDYGLLGIQPAFGPILRDRYPVRLQKAEVSNYLQIAGRIIRRLDPQHLLTAVNAPVNYLAGSLDFIGYHRGAANFLDGLQGKPGFTRQIIPRENHFSIMLSPKTPAIIADLLRKVP